MKRSSLCSLVAASLVGASLLGASTARATLLASESFDCGNGPVLGTAGGVGWVGSWQTDPQISASAQVGAAMPVGPSGLVVQGGSLAIDGTAQAGTRIFRELDLTPGSPADLAGLVEPSLTLFGDMQRTIGKAGGTVWLGFLASMPKNIGSQPGYDAQSHLFQGMDPTQLSQGDFDKDGEILAFGRGDMIINWNFGNTCTHSVCGPGQPNGAGAAALFGDGTTHWGVLRMKFTAQGTEGTMWLDPAPGVTDPTDASAAAGPVVMAGIHFNWIEIGSAPNAPTQWDEYRVATTFGDLSAGATTCNGGSSSVSSTGATSTSGSATGTSTGATSSASTAQGATSSGTGGAAPSGTSSGATQGAGGSGGALQDSGDTSGCACRTSPRETNGGSSLLALLGVIAVGTRLGARRRTPGASRPS